MKAALLCCVLLLAGSAASESVEAKSIVIPDNIVEWIGEQIANLPDSIQNIIDKLPEIIEAIPDLIDRIEEIISVIIDKIPDVIPIILDKLPEIIAQVPAIVGRLREILEQIIERLPELIPVILEKIPEIIAAIPGFYDKIREVLESLDLPDWFPTLPDLEVPEWWPEDLPTLPEYNEPVPGLDTTINEFPSIVQIEVGTGSVWIQGCVGSVLTTLHVLTSARCFSGSHFDPRFRRVRAGSSSRFTDGNIVPVDRALNHPSYDKGSFVGDISIVRLAFFLTMSTNIQQVPIVPEGFALPSSLTVTLAGWGTTAEGSVTSDRDLHMVDLITIDQETCAERWNRIPGSYFPIDNDKLCVGRPETGGRNGDVRDIGAPIYYTGILTGVVSFGASIGNQYFPVVATSVGSYSDWIVANAV